MQWDVGTIDLDWVALKQEPGRANSGLEVLAEEMEAGWEVVAVWYEHGKHAGARALIRRPASDE